jgi:lysozyme
MNFAARRLLLFAFMLPGSILADNCVVNLSHYDLMRPDFHRMKREGIMAVIHEATYPSFERDAMYYGREEAATNAGLLWGAYHFANGSDPIRQADYFLRVVEDSWAHSTVTRPESILLVLDFERNGHYPGGSMRVDQAARFVERIRERTGKYPGIYGSENWLRAALNSRRVSPAQRRVLSNCWLWIANYHYTPRYTEPWNQWHLWQYTGDGRCDLRPRHEYPRSVANIRRAERNIFNGSRAELESFWLDNAWEPGGQTASR